MTTSAALLLAAALCAVVGALLLRLNARALGAGPTGRFLVATLGATAVSSAFWLVLAACAVIGLR